MVKSIIKRIIVGVGIALCLMAIKGNLFLNAHALEVQKAIPVAMAKYDIGTSSAVNTPMEEFTVSGLQIPLYGTTFPDNQYTSRWYFYWNFTNNSHLKIDQPLDMQFLIYTGGLHTNFSVEPLRILIRTGYDSSANVYTCDMHTSFTENQNQGSNFIGYFATAKCKDVVLSAKNFRVFLLSEYITPNTRIGMSAITLYPTSQDSSIVSAIDNNSQKIDKVNDTLNDSTTDDPSGDITSMNNKLATNGSISQLLTLPITLYQSILNATTGSCSSFNLGNLLGTNLTMPCINLSNLLGSTIYNIIDILLCGSFILVFRKRMVDIFNHMTSLNDRGNELE